MSEWPENSVKNYDIRQLDDDGTLLSSVRVEAQSSEAAAKQAGRMKIVDGTERIVVCLDGSPMNEMGVEFWKTRVRRR